MSLANSDGRFHEHESGLLVPDQEETLLEREVITKAEWKLVSRAINDVCAPHNLKFLWQCNDKRCLKHRVCPECNVAHGAFMKRVRTANGYYLQCAHRKLVFDPEI